MNAAARLTAWRPGRRAALMLIPIHLALMGKACDVDVTDQRVADAITEVNQTFRQGYKAMLADIGSKTYALPADKAFSVMRETLIELGFSVLHAERDYYIAVTAPAPTPLNDQEWDRARSADGPDFRRIASRHLGLKGKLAKLSPDGLNIDGIITLVEKGERTTIAITFRFRETRPQPPESILPRREYPPPTASRMGYEKIWKRFRAKSGVWPERRRGLPLTGPSGQRDQTRG